MITTNPASNPPNKRRTTATNLKLVAVVALVLGGTVFAFKVLTENATLSFNLLLDGKPLLLGTDIAVLVDGKPFTSGCTITPGLHHLKVDLQVAELFERRVWTVFGSKDLGALPLETCKGSLRVEVNPTPAKLVLRQGGRIIKEGSSPVTFEKIPLGEYKIEAQRGEYRETHPITIPGRQRVDANINLNLGRVDLSSVPTDAEYRLSGNGHKWEGSLPAVVVDVPVGEYRLTTCRKGAEISDDVSVTAGRVLSHKTEFPYGSLEVNSAPAGLVIAKNGVEIGKAPIVLRDLMPMQYVITASDGENEMAAQIAIKAKEAVKHCFIFNYTSVDISSMPTGASVIRYGKDVGKTPLTLNHIPAGDAKIVLSLQGYRTQEVSICAIENKTNIINAMLVSERYFNNVKQARDAITGTQYADAQKFLATALEEYPNDQTVKALIDETTKAIVQQNEQREESVRNAANARKIAERQAVVAVITKAIEASGGRDALSRIASYKKTFRASGKQDGREYSVQGTLYVYPPNNVRLDQALTKAPRQIGPLSFVVNDGKPTKSTYCIATRGDWWAFEAATGGWVVRDDVPEEIQQDLKDELDRNEFERLVPLLESDYSLMKVSDSADTSETIMVTKNGKNVVTLHFDLKSGLLTKYECEKRKVSGGIVHTVTIRSDFRNFAGVMLPTNLTDYKDGELSQTATMESAEPLNRNDLAVFNTPQSTAQPAANQDNSATTPTKRKKH
jgi:hypothetical protein